MTVRTLVSNLELGVWADSRFQIFRIFSKGIEFSNDSRVTTYVTLYLPHEFDILSQTSESRLISDQVLFVIDRNRDSVYVHVNYSTVIKYN